MIQMEVWEAFQWSGGSHQNSVGLFEKSVGLFANAKDAESVAGKSGRISRKVLVVFESVLDYQENTVTELRKKALAKLTLAERAALGIRE